MAKEPIHPPVKFTSGKGAFVTRQLPDGTTQNICIGLQNVDFFMGCPAQIPGELMPEIIANDGQYSPERLASCRKNELPDERCEYCYDKRKNANDLNLRTITYKGKNSTKGYFEKTFGEDQDPPFRVIRISKFTEGGHPIALPLLMEFLELCRQYGVATVLPTKALPFGKKGLTRKVRECLTQEIIDQTPPGLSLAKLFRKTGSAIYYSLGYEQMETGLVSQGFTSKWRIQQAKRYHEAGVRTSSTVVCDVTSSIKENILQGSAIELALKAREEGLKMRLLPLRLNSRKTANIVGLNWEENHYQEPKKPLPNQDFLGEELENYYEEALELAEEKGRYQRKSSESVPRILHPDFKRLIENGVGVCGQIGDTEYCDQCNLQDNVRITFPVDQKVKVKSNTKIAKDKKKRRQRKRLTKGGQTILFDPYK